jgi:hypothetical protein
MSILWSDQWSSMAVGANAHGTNMNAGEFTAGTSRQIVASGVAGQNALRMRVPSGTGTQRCEVTPSISSATSGQIRWWGWDMRTNAATINGNPWGPLFYQHRRNGTTGNGPISFEFDNGRLWILGWSGTTRESVIDLGPNPGGTWTRIVVGILHHASNGWIEAYRDGQLMERVQPWLSGSVAGDQPSSLEGSTLGPTTPTNQVKFGLYRGGNAQALEWDFKRMVIGTTLQDVALGNVDPGGGGTPTKTAPAAPTPAVTHPEGGVSFTWGTPPAGFEGGGVDLWQIYINGVRQLPDLPGTARAHTISNRSPGEVLPIRISYGHDGAYSPWSDPAVNMTAGAAAPAAKTAPNPPTQSAAPANAITLSWSNPPAGFTSSDTWQIYLDGVQQATATNAARSHTLTGLVGGQTYSVRISYGSGTLFSPWSTAVNMTAGQAPAVGNTLRFTANPAGMQPGTHNGQVVVTDEFGKTDVISVTWTITEPVDLFVDTASIDFGEFIEGGDPAVRSLIIDNQGGEGDTGFTVLQTGASYVGASTQVGSAPMRVDFTFNPDGVATGVKSGNIVIKGDDIPPREIEGGEIIPGATGETFTIPWTAEIVVAPPPEEEPHEPEEQTFLFQNTGLTITAYKSQVEAAGQGVEITLNPGQVFPTTDPSLASVLIEAFVRGDVLEQTEGAEPLVYRFLIYPSDESYPADDILPSDGT